MMAEERKMTATEAEKFYRAKLLEIRYKNELAKSGSGKTSTDSPDFVPSFLKLAAVLKIDRTKLYELKARENSPKEREDGTYDVEEWRAFVEMETGQEDEDGDPHDVEYQRLKRENLRLRNDKERFELMKRKGQLLTISEHLEEVREILEQTKWLTQTIPTRAALLTTDMGVRDSIQKLCEHVAGEFRARLVAATEKATEAEKNVDPAENAETGEAIQAEAVQ